MNSETPKKKTIRPHHTHLDFFYYFLFFRFFLFALVVTKIFFVSLSSVQRNINSVYKVHGCAHSYSCVLVGRSVRVCICECNWLLSVWKTNILFWVNRGEPKIVWSKWEKVFVNLSLSLCLSDVWKLDVFFILLQVFRTTFICLTINCFFFVFFSGFLRNLTGLFV